MINSNRNILSFSWLVKKHPRLVTILSHLMFWFTYLMIHSALMKLNLPEKSFMNLASVTAVFFLPVDILATYFTLYVLMPKLLYTRKYILFIFSFTVSAIPFILLTQVIYYYIYAPIFHPEKVILRGFWEFGYFYYVVATYGIVVLAAAIKLTKRWYEEKDRQAELENQSLKSELTMLKLQISPHFLFNTLNNVDSLIYTDKEKASETIVKLSDIMRYMLYESQHQKVHLSSEIKYLNNLIELHSLRYIKEGFIELNIKGKIDNILIAPLLFVPFVENAIKHGSKEVSSPGITINLDIRSDKIVFSIINYINKDQRKDSEGGIGLINVKRRLELLYANNYDLMITETDKIYNVELIVNL